MPKAARRTPGHKPASSEPYSTTKPASSSTAEPIKSENGAHKEHDNALKENHNPPALREFGHPEIKPDDGHTHPTKQEKKEEEEEEDKPEEGDTKKPRSHLDIVLRTKECSAGHEACTVPVYDNCDEIRAKIRTFLDSKPIIPEAGPTDKNGKTKPYTRNQFIKDIGVNTNSLTQFMKREGEMSGAEIGVYKKAYVFFEKLRIFNNEPKSKARLASEEMNGENGLKIKDPNIHPGGLWLFCHESEDPNDLLTPDEIAKGYYFPKRPFRGRGGRGRGGGISKRPAAQRGGRGGGPLPIVKTGRGGTSKTGRGGKGGK